MQRAAVRQTLLGALLLVAVGGFLFGVGLGHYPLLDPDEGRHAEVARELLEGEGTARFFLPTLEGKPYQEKPPAFYWLVALAYRLGGVGEAAARAPSALAALATVLAVYGFSVGALGIQEAFASSLVLATSLGFATLARFVNLDMTLTACVTLGVLAGRVWLDRPSPRRPPLLPYVAAALGTLVKGPVALLLVGGPLVLAALARSERPPWRAWGLLRGVLIVAAILLVAYGPIAFFDPSYLRHLLHTNLRRFGPHAPHHAPVYYYAIWLPLIFFPWTLIAAPTLLRAAHDLRRRELLWWAGFVVVLFSIARGKLATYVLPALPPLALAAGPALAAPLRADFAWLRAVGWMLAALLGAVCGGAFVPATLLPLTWGSRVLIVAGFGAAAAALAWVLRDERIELVPPLAAGIVAAVYLITVWAVAPAFGKLFSDRDAAVLVNGVGQVPVIAFAARAPSMVFYTRTPVIHTDQLATARDLFAHDQPAFLITGHRHFAEVEQTLAARVHLWHATRRRRLYANVPRPW